MDNLKELLKRQNELGEKIDKARINYKKDGETRKDKEYLQEKISKLNELWEEFSQNHEALIYNDEADPEEKYFKNNYFNAIREIFMEHMETLKNKLQSKFPEEPIYEEPLRSLINNPGIAYKIFVIRATALKRTLNTVTSSEDGTLAYAKMTLKRLEENFSQFEKAYEDLMVTELTREEAEENERGFIQTESNVRSKIVILQSRIDRRSNENNEEKTTTPKLKALDVPKFNGKYDAWTTFHDIFKNLIHNNIKLTDVEKMQHLKTRIDGEAAKIIQHLNISGDNYKTAYELLVHRYDNNRIIFSKLMDTILTHPSANDSAFGIKKLYDAMQECLHGLRNIGIDINDENAVMMHIVMKKLDRETRSRFEQTLMKPREIPTLRELLNFMENRFQALEAVNDGNDSRRFQPQTKTYGNYQQKRNDIRSFYTSNAPKCIACNEQHRTFTCRKYGGMSLGERNELLRKTRACRNCLNTDHEISSCKSSKCKKCGGMHHTSLHFDRQDQNRNQTRSHNTQTENYGVLLATAYIQVKTSNGEYEMLRALIDQGSERSFITEEATQKLRLNRTKERVKVFGIGSIVAGTSRGSVQINMKPRHPSSFETTVQALIMSKLTICCQPSTIKAEYEHTKKLTLADPEYFTSGKIDIMLGADTFGEIVLSGVIRGLPFTPVAQATELGWILSGKIENKEQHKSTISLVSNTELENQLQTFWKVEEIDTKRMMTIEELECEKWFKETCKREESGKYVTSLPFKSKNETKLGKSRHIAVGTFLQLEKKFKTNPELKKEYSKCINEYLELGQMSKAKQSAEKLSHWEDGEIIYDCYYLPHHAVIKESSTTTKLRVVFNASQKTSNGKSLNDTLMVGPTIQDDLADILLRWRTHKIALTADIEKMYRQIAVRNKDANYQRIVWRNEENEEITDYCINTVFFGNAAAPYIAIRTIQQLADDEKENYPIASKILKTDFYVDDLLTGANSIQEATIIQTELRTLLSKGNFNLRKWASNESSCLQNIPEEDKEGMQELKMNFDASIKTLGVYWNPIEDNFVYKVDMGIEKEEYTKRQIVSEVAKLFDPLGWISPVVIAAKIILQEIWVEKTDWDGKVSQTTKNKWTEIREELHIIETIKVPRWIGTGEQTATYQIHGFCDASTHAYAAVIYMKTLHKDGNVTVKLITSKTRVAPIKQITLPKLELCGATLLASLIKKTRIALKLKNVEIYAWTDSMIALAWIKGDAHRRKTFVANRVVEIQSVIEPNNWFHVKTDDNPADVASRGAKPSELKQNKMWWNGPDWLHSTNINVEQPSEFTTTCEQKGVTSLTIMTNNDDEQILKRFSNIDKLIRVVAYCLRFIQNCKNGRMKKNTNALSTKEIRKATNNIIIIAQYNEFNRDIEALKKNTEINKNSNLKTLNPFIDNNGILRVGGRIQNSAMSFNQKHPIIIPYGSTLATLLIRDAHTKTLHGGNQLTIAYLRYNYWIIKAKRAVKTYVGQCIKCCRLKAKMGQQLMGNLPEVRTTVARPFLNTGVDFCGPFDVKISGGRGIKTRKGYIAVFICMAIKAIHLEVVSDLTSEAFIAALKRMISRRGKIANLYSDNGTNFVGANRILLKEFQQLMNSNDTVDKKLAKMSIKWNFIPPSAPHFGGLWEAGVKSVKYHLNRTIGDTKLTYEELTTVLNQIEACLNSRPLSTLSEDPDDLEYLTPGHFLIGEPLLLPAERDLTNGPISLHKRWQFCQRMQQEFWNKWKDEYLTQLQVRNKWNKQTENIKVNDMVIIKDERTSTSKWPLGRVIATHPGGDGFTRVVEIKTGEKVFKRPITKVCILPINTEEFEPKVDKRRKIASANRPITRSMTRNALISMILLALLSMICGESNTRIEKFTNNPGIFFENLGTMGMIETEWNIVAFFDLTGYFTELSTIKKSQSQLESICEMAKNHSIYPYCNIVAKQVRAQVEKINNNNDLLHVHIDNIIRPKRSLVVAAAAGLITGGVAAYHWLSNHETERLDKEINNIGMDELHIRKLIKQQISIVDSTNNIIKRNIEHVDEQFITLANQFDILAHSVGIIEQRKQSNDQIHWIATHLLFIITNYRNTQDHLIEMVINSQTGRMHPSIVTPEQIRQQLHFIENNMPNGMQLPIQGNENKLAEIYKLLTVKLRVTETKAIFSIHLPLISKEEFHIMKAIPVPTRHQTEFIWIEPSANYFIVDKNISKYYTLSENEYQLCNQFSAMKLCKIHHPLYRIGALTGKCEINILRNELELHNSCNLRSAVPTATWIQLHKPNTWIFIMDTKHSFIETCNDIEHKLELQDSGIITFKTNCTIKTDHMLIRAQNEIKTQTSSMFIPTTNLSSIVSRNDSVIPNLTRVRGFTEDKRNMADLSLLQQMINGLKKEAEVKPMFNLNTTDLHQFSLLYGIIILFIIAIFLYAWKQRPTTPRHKDFIVRHTA